MKTKIGLTTRRDIIRSVRKRWTEQYAHYSDNDVIGSRGEERTIAEIKAGLRKLKLQTCSAEEVASVLNDSWTKNECDVCGDDSEVTVSIGSHYNDERWMTVCPACWKKGSDLFSALTSTDHQDQK